MDSIRVLFDTLGVNLQPDAVDANVIINFWVPVFSLMIALLSVLVGPFLQRRSAKEQLKTQIAIAEKQFSVTILSTSRQKWIDSLSENIAEFMSFLQLATDPRNIDPLRHHDPRTLYLINSRIKVLLDPNDLDHNELYSVLNKCSRDIGEFDKKNKIHVDNMTSLNNISHKILNNARKEILFHRKILEK